MRVLGVIGVIVVHVLLFLLVVFLETALAVFNFAGRLIARFDIRVFPFSIERSSYFNENKFLVRFHNMNSIDARL